VYCKPEQKTFLGYRNINRNTSKTERFQKERIPYAQDKCRKENQMTTELVPMDALQQMAAAFAKSRLFGDKNSEQILSLLLLAHGEGIHPAIAMRDFDIVNGKPAKKAEAMLRSFLAAGGTVEWHALDDTQADATFSHPQGGTARIKWDMERVKKAEIKNEAMYKKYPRPMLRSRCVSEGCRTVFPAATSGLYEPGEVAGFAQAKNMGDATIVPPELAGMSREAELADLCKQAGISPKFYLNRAQVESASQMSAEDYAECLAVVRRKIKAQQDKSDTASQETTSAA
jgi:hypothetical protein